MIGPALHLLLEGRAGGEHGSPGRLAVSMELHARPAPRCVHQPWGRGPRRPLDLSHPRSRQQWLGCVAGREEPGLRGWHGSWGLLWMHVQIQGTDQGLAASRCQTGVEWVPV